MIMRDLDQRVINKKVKRSVLSNWMKDNNYLIKDTQINYHDLRKAKDLFEWNKYKRNTITFEQICQIRNRNALFANLKCDNTDNRMFVPPVVPLYGIKSQVVSAIVK